MVNPHVLGHHRRLGAVLGPKAVLEMAAAVADVQDHSVHDAGDGLQLAGDMQSKRGSLRSSTREMTRGLGEKHQ